MAIVYLARDITLRTPVVIKRIRPELAGNEEFRNRIVAEARAMEKIDHENVVRLKSIVVEPREIFLVMEYVDGESLETTIALYAARQMDTPLDLVFRIFDQILAGVGAAHENGVIHRDIKPANILIRRRNSLVKVTDFGIAKTEEDAIAGHGVTKNGRYIGSVVYMSPEQFHRTRNLDRRVDIYALGIMLFQLLTGRVPFLGRTAINTMHMHLNEPIPSITAIRPDVPTHVQSVIEKACAKDPDFRFRTTAEMAAALRGDPEANATRKPFRKQLLLIPVVMAAILAAFVVYKCGQPRCSSSEVRCGDSCCDDPSQYSPFQGGTHQNSSDRCIIDSVKYRIGTLNPTNPCQVCLSANAKTWNSAPRGLPCSEQGKNVCDGSGTCVSVTPIGVGKWFTCGVTPSGSAKCWGVNDRGQLGNGSTNDSLSPTQVVGLKSGVTTVVPIHNHACAITDRGDALCWGANDALQIAESGEDRALPVKVWSGVRGIGGSLSTTCAITGAGSVTCIGSGSQHPLREQSDIIALTSGGSDHICALTATGSVKCWQTGKSPIDMPGLSSGALSVASGHWHTCAIKIPGSVVCWGDNKYGQLGSGDNTDNDVPVQVVGLTSGVVAIALGSVSSCALTVSGTVKCWGRGEHGALGPDIKVDKSFPVTIEALGSDTLAISGGQSHRCVVSDRNAVLCFGWKYKDGGSGDRGRGFRHSMWSVAGFLE
ncbi:MAG: protein kinase [Polyangiaceae bacterium]|nr:protein kinase [Polyangiaceae bacterium]